VGIIEMLPSIISAPMMSIFSAIAILFLLWTFPYLWAIWKTHQMTIPVARNQRIAVEQVSDYLHDLFESGITELEHQGFEVSGYYCTEVDNAEDRKHWHVLLQHGSKHTYAILSVLKPLSSSNPVSLKFATFFTDDCLFCTLNETILGFYRPNPQEITQYLGSIPIPAQWEAHQNKLKTLWESKISQMLTQEAFEATWEAHDKRMIEVLIQNKEVFWSQPNERYRMSIGTSIKAVAKTARNRHRRQLTPAVPSDDMGKDPAKAEAAIALEVEEFHHLQQQRRSGSRRSKTLWLLGSLALFIATYAVIFSPQRLVIFVAVLLLHEGGHVLAMKLFGYRDAAILFIPFLGALATARKDNASLTEKVWISLAGPLPGLCLGIGLAIFTSLRHSDPTLMIERLHQFHWMQETTYMLIFLNLFNLLPVYPLDGGQVTDLLLFSRNPYVGVVFKAIGVGLLGLLGLQKPLLLSFAVIIALTIPTTFRLAKLNVKLRKDLRSIPATDKAGLIQFIFSQLQQPPYNTLSFNQKYGLAVGLLDSHQEQSAPLRTRLGLVVIYLASLLVSVLGMVVALFPNLPLLASAVREYSQFPQVQQQKMQIRITQANQALQKNPKDAKAYEDRGQAKLVLKDLDGALEDANQALALDPNSARGYTLRGEILGQRGNLKAAKADWAKGSQLLLGQDLQHANQALVKNPRNINAYINRAEIKTGLKDYKGAIADSTQALKLDPKNIDARLVRGAAALQLEDYKGAIADTSEVIRLEPENAYAYELRSMARKQLGDKTGANTDAQTAERLDPS
jgi:tetratricopeptide (TPR) repeat protein/Zn-dependent protease